MAIRQQTTDYLLLACACAGILLMILLPDALSLVPAESVIVRLDLLLLALISAVSVYLGFWLYWQKAAFYRYIYLSGLFGLSVYLLFSTGFTRDKLHFFGYAVISFLFFRALRHNFQSQLLYFLAFLFLVVFACLDETLQFFSQARSFQISDIKLDVLAGLISQAVIALVLRPSLLVPEIRIKRYSSQQNKIGRLIKKYRS